jgi:uncharacterized protein (TIGR00266 family)
MPTFAHVVFELGPGEQVITESGAMVAMSKGLSLRTGLAGGLLQALMRRVLGRESAFINTFSNATNEPQFLQLAPSFPGTIRELQLQNSTFYLEGGAYLCSTPDIKIGVRWAGFRSMFAGEGLFRLQVSGTGTVWLSAFGAMVERNVQGQYLVDTGHLLAYEPTLKVELQLAGGIFSSFFGGEGLVARMRGQGRIITQTRSMSGFASFINPHL